MSGPVAVGSWIFFVDFQQPASWWVESWPIPNNGNGLRPMETNLDPCPFLLRLLELKNSHPPKNQKTSVNYTLEPAGFEKNYGVTSKLSIFICLLLAKIGRYKKWTPRFLVGALFVVGRPLPGPQKTKIAIPNIFQP